MQKESRQGVGAFFLKVFLLVGIHFAVQPASSGQLVSCLINKVFVEGNKTIGTDAVLARLPYKSGQVFDPSTTSDALDRVYSLGYFSQVQLERESAGSNSINLIVVVKERKRLDGVEIRGAGAVKEKKILEKLDIEKVEAIDEEFVDHAIAIIKEMHRQENRHKVTVTSELVPHPHNQDTVKLILTIDEGPQTIVRKVVFKGNKKVPGRKLASVVFTREQWLMSMMDRSGTYNPEMFELDKHRIEYFYQNLGYLNAKVVDVTVDKHNEDTVFDVTFHIEEGDRYKVRYLYASGDSDVSEESLRERFYLEEGEPFSREKLEKTIASLRSVWSSKGYLYADVYPQMNPNEETKEVDVTFSAEKGSKIYVKRIDITGNHQTKDDLIRRQMTFQEGDVITSQNLDLSRDKVQFLSYFANEGVNWRIHRISEDKANLELNVKEGKTGHANAQLSYGGEDRFTKSHQIKGTIEVSKDNCFGRGWDVGLRVEGSYNNFQKFEAFFNDGYFLGSNIAFGANVYRNRNEYETWSNLNKTPVEEVTGGTITFGFILTPISDRLRLVIETGFEHIKNDKDVRAMGDNIKIFQKVLDRTFQSGNLQWFNVALVQDTRNHRVYPNHGYKIQYNISCAPGFWGTNFSYYKNELDMSWYTPLIGEHDLVLGVHGRAGFMNNLSDSKQMPYKELFHMGGQNTVRGFLWGGIEPAWRGGVNSATMVPIGARKAVQFNAELIFPLLNDSMKGHFFYDAGAGWDTPKEGIPKPYNRFITRDQFNIRHSVGFGFNLSSPVPAKIDWGYKLNRDRRNNESPYEFHISMNMAW